MPRPKLTHPKADHPNITVYPDSFRQGVMNTQLSPEQSRKLGLKGSLGNRIEVFTDEEEFDGFLYYESEATPGRDLERILYTAEYRTIRNFDHHFSVKGHLPRLKSAIIAIDNYLKNLRDRALRTKPDTEQKFLIAVSKLNKVHFTLLLELAQKLKQPKKRIESKMRGSVRFSSKIRDELENLQKLYAQKIPMNPYVIIRNDMLDNLVGLYKFKTFTNDNLNVPSGTKIDRIQLEGFEECYQIISIIFGVYRIYAEKFKSNEFFNVLVNDVFKSVNRSNLRKRYFP